MPSGRRTVQLLQPPSLRLLAARVWIERLSSSILGWEFYAVIKAGSNF